MITISQNNSFITMINVFTVEAKDQQQLLNLLTLATRDTVCEITGFVSASLHKSTDGTKVTMYAQWRSKEDYQNMRNNAVASPYLDQALALVTFEPGMYEVAETFLPV